MKNDLLKLSVRARNVMWFSKRGNPPTARQIRSYLARTPNIALASLPNCGRAVMRELRAWAGYEWTVGHDHMALKREYRDIAYEKELLLGKLKELQDQRVKN